MVQQSKNSPVINRKKKEDPLYPEFDNYNKTIDEDQKMAEEYTSLQGNKFDRDIDRLLKKRRDKREQSQSPNLIDDPNVSLAPDLATLWPKKTLNSKTRKKSKADR